MPTGPYSTYWMRRFTGQARTGHRYGGTWTGIRARTRHYWGSVRTAERNALAHGVEPEPTRTRSGINWDYL